MGVWRLEGGCQRYQRCPRPSSGSVGLSVPFNLLLLNIVSLHPTTFMVFLTCFCALHDLTSDHVLSRSDLEKVLLRSFGH